MRVPLAKLLLSASVLNARYFFFFKKLVLFFLVLQIEESLSKTLKSWKDKPERHSLHLLIRGRRGVYGFALSAE